MLQRNLAHPAFFAKLRRYWLALALPCAAVLCFLIATRLNNSFQANKVDRDFLPFWLAGNMIIKGENPYDARQWADGYSQYETSLDTNPAFLYPLPLALILAPLGLLSYQNAYIVWVTIAQLMILGSLAVLISLENDPRSKLLFVPLLAGIILFRPTILAVGQGQVSGLLLFILAWVGFLWQKGKWFWGGLLVGLLALKPNLGILLIGLPATWLIVRRRWSAIFGMFVCGISLLIAGLAANPDWVSQYWQIGNAKLAVTFGGSPTVWGLGALISHNQTTGTLFFGSLAGLLVLSGFFWTALRPRAILGPAGMLALAVTVTLLITPYTWTYDQLLLVLPMTVVILAMQRKGIPFMLTALLFPGLDALVVVLLYFDAVLQVEILNVFIPAIVLGIFLWIMRPRLPAQA